MVSTSIGESPGRYIIPCVSVDGHKGTVTRRAQLDLSQETANYGNLSNGKFIESLPVFFYCWMIMAVRVLTF